MSTTETSPAAANDGPLRVGHRGWSGPLTRPAMSTTTDRHDRVSITDRFLELSGRPAIPVMGELHYSRVPRDDWSERLASMRASGVTVVASYLIWIHHEEERGVVRFDGGLDVAEFVRTAIEADLDVVLRVGPWAHGELRNGGFPDWLVASGARLRSNDPAYLRFVEEWFGELGRELGLFCRPDGRVIGIQLENELYDQPDHLLELKRLARAAGLHAPLWTATGWGGAQLPRGEVMPLFAAYSDGFWVDADAPWDPTFREHFLFSDVWDDPGVGADIAAGSTSSGVRAGLDPAFPPATCEIGGGMATAYQRRPWPAPQDIAAIANVKLGNGSAWQGFYMYGGGVNPAGADGLQESHATGYPNDLPRFDYDFHAPFGASGRPGPTLDRLRDHNMFLEAFGPALATMPASLPERRPDGVLDRDVLRWSLRSDGRSGFVFIGWHQPHDPLPVYRGARFELELGARTVVLPDRPVDVPPGTVARWPVDLVVDDVRLAWATATPMTVLRSADGAAPPLLVLRSHPGIPPRAAWGDDEATDLVVGTAFRVQDRLDVVVLDDADAQRLWRVGDELLLADTAVWADGDRLLTRSVAAPTIRRWDPAARRFRPVMATGPTRAGAAAELDRTPIRGAAARPRSYGELEGRASAPTRAQLDAVAAVWRLRLPATAAGAGTRRHLVVDWAGDVAQLRRDGVVVADRFWDGDRWTVRLPDDVSGDWTLHVAPLRRGVGVGITEAMAPRLHDDEDLCALDAVRLEESAVWELTGREA